MLLAIFLGQQPTAFGFREFCKFHGIIIVGESKLRCAIFILASSPILVSHRSIRSIIATAREFQNSDKFQDSRDSRGLLK